jgi:hypothetical protein
VCSPWRERLPQLGLSVTHVDPTCNAEHLRAETSTTLDDARARWRSQGYDLRHHRETPLDVARERLIAVPPNNPPFSISIHECCRSGLREIQMSPYRGTTDGTFDRTRRANERADECDKRRLSSNRH